MKRIKLAALENDRSINAEISSRLENSFDLADNDRREIRSLLTDAIAVIDRSRK